MEIKKRLGERGRMKNEEKEDEDGIMGREEEEEN